jgi:hypothetical protein
MNSQAQLSFCASVRANERAIDNVGYVKYSEWRTPPTIEKRILTINHSLAYPGGKSTRSRGFSNLANQHSGKKTKSLVLTSSSQDTAAIQTSRTATIRTHEDENEHEKKTYWRYHHGM